MRISHYVSIPVLLTLASCIAGGFESGEYDYNYDSPAAAGSRDALAIDSTGGFDLLEIPAMPAVVVHLEAGQTLYSLSVEHLGSGGRWREIAVLNGFSDAQIRNLPIGQAIKLPGR